MSTGLDTTDRSEQKTSAPTPSDSDGHAERYVTTALAASAAIIFWDAFSSMQSLIIPMLIFCAALKFPRVRNYPGTWFVAAAIWVPTLVVDWRDHQDHVYLAVYWLLAVGLTLTQSQARDQIRLLAHHARYLVGLTFACAVVWKLTAASFLNGALFRHVFTFDERFEWPFNELIGRTSPEALERNQVAWDALQTTSGTPQPVALELGGGLPYLVGAFVIMTLIVEFFLAASFLAPTGSRLHESRHYVLLGFSWAVYPWIPVTGFAVLLMMLGALTAPDRPRLQRVYAISAAAFMLALFIRAATL